MTKPIWTAELRSQVMQGLGWKAFSQISVQVMALVTTIFIAHLLTPSEVGLVAMATVFSALALILSDLALGAALVQRETLTEEDRSSAFWLNVGFGLVLTLAGVALAGPIANLYGEPEVEPLFQVISITFLLAALGTTQNALLIRDMRFRSLEVRSVVSTGLAGAVAIALAIAGAGPWAIVGQKLTVNAASTILVWRAAHWRPRFMVSMASLRHLVNFSRWIVGARLLSYVNANADNYLIGRYVGSAGLGAYSIAYNVMLVPLTRLASPVQQVFYPALSKIREPVGVGKAWLHATKLVALFTLPAFAGMAVVAPDFVRVVLGEQWDASVRVIQILCWVGIVGAVVSQAGRRAAGARQDGVGLPLHGRRHRRHDLGVCDRGAVGDRRRRSCERDREHVARAVLPQPPPAGDGCAAAALPRRHRRRRAGDRRDGRVAVRAAIAGSRLSVSGASTRDTRCGRRGHLPAVGGLARA